MDEVLHSIGHILWWLTAVTLAALTSAHAITKRRDPRAASWWILMVWTMPFVGALLYWFFGINRIERKAARLRRKIKPLSGRGISTSFEVKTDFDSSGLKSLSGLARLVERVVKRPLLSGNDIIPLFNGDEAYPAMIKAIDEATCSIGLSTYIFNFDRAGSLFIEALVRAAQRGVKVRVLIDDVGSGFSWRSVYKELNSRHIPVAYFLPTLVPWRVTYFNLRNHRKILIIDGKIGFTGGMNIHEGHILAVPSPLRCSDIHFKLAGPVLAEMQEAFGFDWTFTTGEVLEGPDWYPEIKKEGTMLARCISDGPDADFEKCRWTILSALANAKRSVKIVTPYLIPDSSLITGLGLAAMSGVKVDIILPGKGDLRVVRWASSALLWQLLERGCRVWMSPPPFDHSKLMLVDGGWTLFGSTNWDARSLRLNFEFNVECYDENFTQSLEKMVDQKIKKARLVTLKEMDSRPFPLKLRDGVARLFSPVL